VITKTRPPRTRRSILDDEFGLVRWVAEVPQSPDDPKIFNYAVKMASTGEYLPLICFSNNGGAGLTREHAYRAALGEAVERYCSSVFFKEDLLLGTYASVSKESRAIKPGELSLFHPSQRGELRYSWFTEETKLCWTAGYSLTKRERVLVPASLVYVPYYGFYHDDQGEESIGPGISTGQASGYSDAEALLSGLYEVIERDAFSILWLNRMSVPKIDIASDAKLGAIYREHFARKNLECVLYDMTSDIRVPSILCMMIDHSADPPMICTGGATHWSPQRAGVKALVEAAQTLQWARYLGEREEPFVIASDYNNIDDFEKHVYLYGYGNRLGAVEFLRRTTQTVPLSALPGAAFVSPARELRAACRAVEEKGYEVLAVDLTSVDVAECGYRALKVMVPQMQHLEGDHSHRFLACKRIYEVPALLGYPAKVHPDELNPDPHPYP
jgi:ribosomal protein S12 methylthiotransferase accessory factor